VNDAKTPEEEAVLRAAIEWVSKRGLFIETGKAPWAYIKACNDIKDAVTSLQQARRVKEEGE